MIGRFIFAVGCLLIASAICGARQAAPPAIPAPQLPLCSIGSSSPAWIARAIPYRREFPSKWRSNSIRFYERDFSTYAKLRMFFPKCPY